MNKRWMILLIASVFLMGLPFRSFAAALYVICNSELTITPDAVKGIFLGETQFSGSIKLEPTDNVAAQTDFLSKVMGMEKEKYDASWVKKSFRDGINPPQSRGSDMEIIEFIKQTPGGIGYVLTAPSGVKVIQQY
jgi:hypothetical protein